MKPSGPYAIHSTGRLCPGCHGRIVTMTSVTLASTQGMLHRLGISCLCAGCNHRYRATSYVRYAWLAWAGALGRWLWWQTTTLEKTTPNLQ